jgi:hypothetical protein
LSVRQLHGFTPIERKPGRSIGLPLLKAQ